MVIFAGISALWGYACAENAAKVTIFGLNCSQRMKIYAPRLAKTVKNPEKQI
jgi:hypothetical protein